jgi:hypothetical protein
MTTRRVTKTLATSLTMLALPLMGAGAGCFQQKPLCPALDSCGGGLPVGDWILDSNMAATSASCSEELYTPPEDPRLIGADLPPARTPPPDPALYDWCDLLVTTPNMPSAALPKIMTTNSIVARTPNFGYTTFPIGAATIHYGANNQYALSTTRTGQFLLDFPAYCMREFGAVDTCTSNPCMKDPTALPATTGTVCDKLTDALNVLAPANYSNIVCQAGPDDPLGCVCRYNVAVRETSMGTVGIDPNNPSDITHLPGTQFPQDATYCVQGNQLELTGTDGQYLFDRLGLRTLDLVKVTVDCTDGKQGPGEDGVDCGAACLDASGAPKFCQ